MRLRFCNKDDLVVGLMMLGVLLFALSCSGGKGQGGDDDADDAEEASIQRVSVASDGTQSDDDSLAASISSDGNITAFESFASTLVAGNITNFSDIYIHNIDKSTTERITDNIIGAGSDGNSQAPSIDADGKLVAFQSEATDLVAGDDNSNTDIFVYDTTSATTDIISLDVGDSGADGDSTSPAISADGGFVAFQSDATDLVGGDDNSNTDIFVYDTTSATTDIISLDVGGFSSDGDSTSPAINEDGSIVAFQSAATDLVVGDDNGRIDIFVYDSLKDETVIISQDFNDSSADGDSTAPSISADGSLVAYQSAATDLVPGDVNGQIDIFVTDLDAGNTEIISIDVFGQGADGDSTSPSISADGRFVAFQSEATDLVFGDSNGQIDIFIWDRQNNNMVRINLNEAGNQAQGSDSLAPAISADGKFVAFDSAADNLVANDTNGKIDVFVAPNSLVP